MSVITFSLFISLVVPPNEPLLFLFHCWIFFSSFDKAVEVILEAVTDEIVKVSQIFK